MKLFSRSSTTALGLDTFCFAVADVRDGLGPFLVVFLTGLEGWNPSRIGFVLSATSLAGLFGSLPAGWIIDRVRHQTWLLGTCACVIALLCFAIPFFTHFIAILLLQVLIGLTGAFISPALASFTLRLQGLKNLPSRLGRNESFNHAGTMVSAAIAAGIAKFSPYAVFALLGTMSLIAIIAILFVPSAKRSFPALEIDEKNQRSGPPSAGFDFRSIFNAKPLRRVLAASFLFQLCNASLLPLMIQASSTSFSESSVSFLSKCIFVAQISTIPTAYFGGRFAARFSARFLLIMGSGAIVARCLIFAWVRDPQILICGQIFDGIAAGVLAVAPISEIARQVQTKTDFGKFAGLLSAVIGLGAAISSGVTGWMVELLGFQQVFFILGTIATLVAVFLAQDLIRDGLYALLPDRNLVLPVAQSAPLTWARVRAEDRPSRAFEKRRNRN